MLLADILGHVCVNCIDVCPKATFLESGFQAFPYDNLMDSKQTPGDAVEQSLAQGLREMLDNAEGDRVAMREFFDCFREKGFGILLLLFSLPSALPVPAPGYSIPFGIILGLLALQLVLGRKTPWLPDWVLNISFKTRSNECF